MSDIRAVKCDGCGVTANYREGGDMLPKGWAHIEVTPSSSCRCERLDLCEKCFTPVRLALPQEKPE